MERFAFAFYATQWREGLTWPLRVCLHSLDTRGGAAARYPRYLVYSETVTPEIRAFCDRHRLVIQHERRLTYRQALPNKALMCRVPEHEVVCLADVDLVFLDDPTPMFERAAATGRVHSRYDIIAPLWYWPWMPEKWRPWLRSTVGWKIWRDQYRRFAPTAPLPEPGPTCSEGIRLLPYFNTGVNVVPGQYLRRLGKTWWYIASRFLRDRQIHRPYIHFLTPYFYEQMSYALALHRERIPWAVLPVTYNFIPWVLTPTNDKCYLSEGSIAIAHVVSPIRNWLAPEEPANCPDEFAPLMRRVRSIMAEVPRDGAGVGRSR